MPLITRVSDSFTRPILFVLTLILPLVIWADTNATSRSIYSETLEVSRQLKDPQIFNASTCGEYIRNVTEYVFKLPSDYFVPKTKLQTERLVANTQKLSLVLWGMRLLLRDKLKRFFFQGTLSKDCLSRMRQAHRFIRFTEEFLGEWYFNETKTVHRTKVFFGSPPSFLTNPKFVFEDVQSLQSGDVLMDRGTSFVSSTISRIGDDDGQFSHIAMIYEDKMNGQKYVVESLIELGLILTPIQEWASGHVARVAVFRHSDAKLAHEAAHQSYTVAKTAIDQGSSLPYDFSMNLNSDDSAFYCAEVARYGFKDKLDLPTHRTTFNGLAGNPFLKKFGIDVIETFNPGDIEVEPHFDLVAEWRNFDDTRNMRVTDAILTKVFEWIEERKYSLYPDASIKGKAFILRALRQLGYFKDLLAKHMELPTLRQLLALKFTVEPIEQYMIKYEQDYFEKHGHSMTYPEIFSVVEQLRSNDCDVFHKEKRYVDDFTEDYDPEDDPGKPMFHWIFNRFDESGRGRCQVN